MPDEIKNILIKRYDGSAWQTIYPKTTMGQVEGLIDGSGKIKLSNLPADVVGGLKYVTTYSDGATVTWQGLDSFVKQELNDGDDDGSAIRGFEGGGRGSYLVVGVSTLTITTPSYTMADITYNFSVVGYTGNSITLQNGDFLVFNSVIATTASSKTYQFSVINNTYDYATTGVPGIVKLATTSTSSNEVVTSAVLNSKLSSYSTSATVNSQLSGKQTLNTTLTKLSSLTISAAKGLLGFNATGDAVYDTTDYVEEGKVATVVSVDNNQGTMIPTNLAVKNYVTGFGYLTSSSSLNAAKLTGTVPASCYTNTTYSVATTSSEGLMSSTMVSKLNGIATGANNYSLPAATGSSRGGITVGDGLAISSDKLSLGTLTASGGSVGQSASATAGFGGTFQVPYITYDKYGRVTAAVNKTITIGSSVASASSNGLMTSDHFKALSGLLLAPSATLPTTNLVSGVLFLQTV